MNFLSLYIWLSLLLTLAACSDQPVPENSRSISPAGEKAGIKSDPNAKNGEGKDGSDDSTLDEEGNPKKEDEKDIDDTDDTVVDNTPKVSEGKKFFLASVEPLFKTDCETCHVAPRFNPPKDGPLSIYDYESMKIFLSKSSYTENQLMNKLRDITTHEGGNVCGTNLEVGICKTVKDWWVKEYGTPPEETGGINLVSSIDDITVLGEVYGYAADGNDPESTLTVTFYEGGDKDNGTELDTVVASLAGYSNGVNGNHRYQYELGAGYKDGTSRQIYAYATVDGELYEMADSPYTYIAYTPKGSGSYYDANVAGVMSTNCSSCHNDRSYLDFEILLSPTPGNGGTRDNNLLYNKANGISHSGGDVCDTACENALKAWYDDELN